MVPFFLFSLSWGDRKYVNDLSKALGLNAVGSQSARLGAGFGKGF